MSYKVIFIASLSLFFCLEILAQEQKKVIQYSSELHPSFSPGGSEVVFYSNAAGGDNIYALDITTGKRTQLTKGDTQDENPTWSPTGEYIAFHSYRNGSADIYIIKPDGSGLKRMTTNDYEEISPAWSPDGRELVYSADVAGNWQLFVIDIESGNTRQITKGKRDYLSPAWGQDQHTIYFGFSYRGKHQTEVELRKLDLIENAHEPVIKDSEVNSNISVSPASDVAVFNSLRDQNWEIYTMDISGIELRRITENSKKLPDFEYADIDGQPTLSADGKRIAFLSGRAGSFDIYLMNIDGTNLLNLTKDWVLK